MPKLNIKQETVQLQKEVRTRLVGYVVAALGLVAGLAWNDAIKAAIDHFFPAGGSSIWVKFIYAILISIAIIVVTVVISRALAPNHKDMQEK